MKLYLKQSKNKSSTDACCCFFRPICMLCRYTKLDVSSRKLFMYSPFCLKYLISTDLSFVVKLLCFSWISCKECRVIFYNHTSVAVFKVILAVFLAWYEILFILCFLFDRQLCFLICPLSMHIDIYVSFSQNHYNGYVKIECYILKWKPS